MLARNLAVSSGRLAAPLDRATQDQRGAWTLTTVARRCAGSWPTAGRAAGTGAAATAPTTSTGASAGGNGGARSLADEPVAPDTVVFGTGAILSEPPVEPYSFPGISQVRFPDDVANVLLAPIDAFDVEIKPDGLLYLPEIKYRRILNKAFGPGGWGLMPRSQHHLQGDTLSREYALFAFGRFVSQARGEQQVFEKAGIATASEGVKSNALMRCCKDIGIASELWDPIFIQKWKAKFATERWVEHSRTKSKSRMWRRLDRKFDYPYAEPNSAAPPAGA